MFRNCLRPQCWLEGVSSAPRILAEGHDHDSSTQSLQHPEVLHNESENKHRRRTLVVRALTWRRLVGVQRVQDQAEARVRQTQLAQQDPHAAGHIPLTARALTHSVRRHGRGSQEHAWRYALVNGRCVTEAAAAEPGDYIAARDVTTATSPP